MEALGPNSLATVGPYSVSLSAMVTLAPCFTNSWAVAFPSPLADPVITAIFPSSRLLRRCDFGSRISLGSDLSIHHNLFVSFIFPLNNLKPAQIRKAQYISRLGLSGHGMNCSQISV